MDYIIIGCVRYVCIFMGYTNVLKIDLKCPEKYIKAYIFFIIQWIEFKFENVKYISIYLTNI
jgi:hypothetical protein